MSEAHGNYLSEFFLATYRLACKGWKVREQIWPAKPSTGENPSRVNVCVCVKGGLSALSVVFYGDNIICKQGSQKGDYESQQGGGGSDYHVGWLRRPTEKQTNKKNVSVIQRFSFQTRASCCDEPFQCPHWALSCASEELQEKKPEKTFLSLAISQKSQWLVHEVWVQTLRYLLTPTQETLTAQK